jgi:hypothetical protein
MPPPTPIKQDFYDANRRRQQAFSSGGPRAASEASFHSALGGGLSRGGSSCSGGGGGRHDGPYFANWPLPHGVRPLHSAGYGSRRGGSGGAGGNARDEVIGQLRAEVWQLRHLQAEAIARSTRPY